MTQDELRKQVFDLINENKAENLELIKAQLLKIEDINKDITLNGYSPINGAPCVIITDIFTKVCEENNIDLAKYIFSLNKLNINKICSEGDSYLYKSLKVKIFPIKGDVLPDFVYDFSIAKLLIEHGAEVNNINNRGDSALHNLSSDYENDECEFLISHGVNINHKNNLGMDALSSLSRLYNMSMIRKLLALGAYINIADIKGATALHCSTIIEFNPLLLSSYGLTKLLLQNGFDVLQKMNNVCTIFSFFVDPRERVKYEIGEAPIKYLPLAWIKDELKSPVPTNNIYKFELYRGLKYYENKGNIKKEESLSYYPSKKAIDFVNGCFADLSKKMVELDLNSKTNRTILDSVTKNATNLTTQLFDTEYVEPIKRVDVKQIGARFSQKIHQKLNVKKYEFTSEWYKFLFLCKETDNLGNLKILPPELIANIGCFIIDALQEESIAYAQKGFVARPLISELQATEESLQEFETLLSGLSSDEFNNRHDY